MNLHKYKFVILLPLILTVFISKGEAYYQKQPRWDSSFDWKKHAQIEKELQTQGLKKLISMRAFLKSKGHTADFDSPEVYLAVLNNGLKGVFKVRHPKEIDNAHAEVAAYKASCHFDIYLVPPTVMRTFNGKTGSLQFYVEPSMDLLKDGNYLRSLSLADTADVANMKVFSFLLGQWDNGPHNLIVQKNKGVYSLALIDNEAIFKKQKIRHGDFAFVQVYLARPLGSFYINSKESESFPFDVSTKPLSPNPEEIKRTLGKNISSSSLVNYLSKVKLPIYYRIWKGEFWHQIHKGNPDPCFQPLYINFCPRNILNLLKKLNESDIRKMFSIATKDKFFNQEYINDILERRDQILKAVEEK